MFDATMVRFAVISGFTYALDLALLTVCHGVLGWPLPVAITTGYGVAFTTNYVLNRSLNFRSHAPIGVEGAKYVAVVAVNFLVFLLGLTTGLAAAGVEYQLARIIAGGCEGVFLYVALRWFVFGPSRRDDAEREPVG